jgi:hypothetical protein
MGVETKLPTPVSARDADNHDDHGLDHRPACPETYFGRMPKPCKSFTLQTGEMVKEDRVDIGKPAPGKSVTPISAWITPKG